MLYWATLSSFCFWLLKLLTLAVPKNVLDASTLPDLKQVFSFL